MFDERFQYDFFENGYAIVNNIFSTSEADTIRALIEQATGTNSKLSQDRRPVRHPAIFQRGACRVAPAFRKNRTVEDCLSR